ncbi:MAG: NADH-quinone oxidoreductase subunit J [Acidobacteriota bacterium]
MGSLEQILFLGAAAGAIVSGLMVIWHRSAVLSALFLVANLGCIAILFLTLGGQFLAAVQVLVYAGAIMVLFLFVIMLLNPAASGPRFRTGRAGTGLAFALGVLFVGALVRGVWGLRGSRELLTPVHPGFGSAVSVGKVLFGPYLYPFELTALLLLVAMVGAVVLAKKDL